MPVPLCIVSGCFCAIMAELNSWDKAVLSTEPKIFTIWFFRESVPCLHL